MSLKSFDMRLMIVVLISLVALFIRFDTFINRGGLLGDERTQYELVREIKFLPVWRNDIAFDDVTTFPGHYLFLYPFIKSIDIDSFAVRFPAIVMQFLFFVLFYLCCNTIFKTVWGFLIAFLIVSFNVTLINHAFELRPYSSLPTFALFSFYCSDLIIRQKIKLHWMWKILILILYMFMASFYAYAIFFILLPAVYQLISNKIYKLNDLQLFDYRFLFMTIIASLFVWGWYMTGFMLGSLTGRGHLAIVGLDTFQHIPNPFVDVLGFLKSIIGNLIGRKELYVLLMGFIYVYFMPKLERTKHVQFFVFLVLTPLVLMCLASVFAKYVFIQRHFIWVMPFFAIVIGWQWDYFFFKRAERKRS